MEIKRKLFARPREAGTRDKGDDKIKQIMSLSCNCAILPAPRCDIRSINGWNNYEIIEPESLGWAVIELIMICNATCEGTLLPTDGISAIFEIYFGEDCVGCGTLQYAEELRCLPWRYHTKIEHPPQSIKSSPSALPPKHLNRHLQHSARSPLNYAS